MGKVKGMTAHEIVADIKRVAYTLNVTPSRREYLAMGMFTQQQVDNVFGGWVAAVQAAGCPTRKPARHVNENKTVEKVLCFDIETAPMLAYVWGLWDQNVALNQIAQDWHVMSWAAKWLDGEKIFYADQRNAKDIKDDKKTLEGIWKLLNEADVVVTQNGKNFDSKKLNARFIMNGMPPPSPYKHIDTLVLAKRHFAFSSNKLEYLSDKLTVNKKSKHKKFAGFDLWVECIKGNKEAWAEMEHYNKQDVVTTEELYKRLAPWGGTGVNLNIFRSAEEFLCQCGSNDLKHDGYHTTNTGKFRRFVCQNKKCGAWLHESGAGNNVLTKIKRFKLKSAG
jgi:uncharacterized protein YprB with RNaseH-like and TPR domain